jgi:arsenite methyltransferase
LQVDRVVATLGITPGMRIADLGAGTGIFTIPMAKAAGPTGRVFAIDVDPGLLAIISDKAKIASLPTVQTIVAGDVDPKIPEPVDLIFICDTMHHLPNQAQYVKGLGRYLKPSGRVVVIDFAEGHWPAGHDAFRITPAQVTGWMEAAGFSLETSHSYLASNFFHVYRLKSAD